MHVKVRKYIITQTILPLKFCYFNISGHGAAKPALAVYTSCKTLFERWSDKTNDISFLRAQCRILRSLTMGWQ